MPESQGFPTQQLPMINNFTIPNIIHMLSRAKDKGAVFRRVIIFACTTINLSIILSFPARAATTYVLWLNDFSF
jgi:hypothetical protein